MSAAVRATALANNGTTSASQGTAQVVIPSSTQTNDVGIFIMTENINAPVYTAPSGWTSIAGQNVLTSNQSTQVWAKVMSSSEAGTTETFSSGTNGKLSGILAIISGADTTLTNIVSAYGTQQGVTTGTSPTLTTTVSGCLIVNLWSVRAATATASTLTAGSGQTADGSTQTAYSTSPNFTDTVTHTTTATGAAGTYGGASATADQSSNWCMYTLAIPANPVTYATGQFFPFF